MTAVPSSAGTLTRSQMRSSSMVIFPVSLACMLTAVASPSPHHGEASRFHDLELSWS
jgi:hypothetical protein